MAAADAFAFVARLNAAYWSAETDEQFEEAVREFTVSLTSMNSSHARVMTALLALEYSKGLEPESRYRLLVAIGRRLDQNPDYTMEAAAFRSAMLAELYRLILLEWERRGFTLEDRARNAPQHNAAYATLQELLNRRLFTGAPTLTPENYPSIALALFDGCAHEQTRYDTYVLLDAAATFADAKADEDPNDGLATIFDFYFERDGNFYCHVVQSGKHRHNDGPVVFHGAFMEGVGHTDDLRVRNVNDDQSEARRFAISATTDETFYREFDERLLRLSQRVGNLEGRVKRLEDALTQVQQQLTNLSEEVRRLADNQDEFSAELEKMWERTRRLEEQMRRQGYVPHDPMGAEAAKWAAVFDFDGDSCYPAPAAYPDGRMNLGLKTTGRITGGCRDELEQAHTYHRAVGIEIDGDRYEVHMYALYFEKDQVVTFIDGDIDKGLRLVGEQGGHKHDWEFALIWLKNGALTHASCSAHGDVDTKPIFELHFQRDKTNNVAIVYHKGWTRVKSPLVGTIASYPSTHSFRFGKRDERAENERGEWVTPEIMSWHTMRLHTVSNRELRARFNEFDYGPANCSFNDRNFPHEVGKNPPPGYPDGDCWRAAAKVAIMEAGNHHKPEDKP